MMAFLAWATSSPEAWARPHPRSLFKHDRRKLRPAVGRLETRLSPGLIQPPALEQVFLERMNDYRATLVGINRRPFALLPALDEFAVKAAQTRNGNALKNAM